MKNGYVFCSKYESRVKQLSPCHVVVFMNEDPDMNKLSKDRYVIRRDFGAMQQANYDAVMESDEFHYRARVTWQDPAATAQFISALPKNDAEIAAWAQTIGPGIHIRNVDVVTGEF